MNAKISAYQVHYNSKEQSPRTKRKQTITILKSERRPLGCRLVCKSRFVIPLTKIAKHLIGVLFLFLPSPLYAYFCFTLHKFYITY